VADPDVAAGALADSLLVREALRCRALGSQPDPLAGLRIDEAEVERLVAQLSGGDRKEGRASKDVERAVERSREAFHAALREDGLVSHIVGRAGLTPPEAEVLGLLAAVELDARRQRLLGYVQDDVTKTRPTLATLRRLFGDDGVLGVSPEGRLRRAALVRVDDASSWATKVVTLCEPVTWALVGDTSIDPDMPRDAFVQLAAVPQEGAAFVLVSGEDRTRRLQLAMEATVGDRFLVVPLPTSPEGWQAVIREATLGGLGVVLEVEEALTADARWWIELAEHLPFAISSRSELALEELPRRRWVERRAGAAEATDEEWGLVTSSSQDRHGHRLTAEQLRLVATALPGVGGDIDAAVRRLASGPLDRLARRIRPSRTWDDIILSPDRIVQLREVAVRYRHRDTVYADWGFPPFPSTGLVALFSGQSGTGKTLAAEIIAGDLGLDLYKLDLSSVVSKYIGETEKNLEKVFSAASAGNLVLFFDEADSLFGKRSEVTDARDRYANIEVSYLLQRLEAYDGLVVMATNFQKNIDDAFLRRIHVGIDFPMPEEPERRAIWQHAFPPGAPTKDLDWDFLARQFKLAGGNIKGAALHSAFLAAEAGSPITMEMVMLALKREFQKLGRLRTSAEFDRYTDFVNSTP